MNNVIEFPNKKIPEDLPPSPEELQESFELVRNNHVLETTSFLCEILLETLDTVGFKFDESNQDIYNKDLGLVLESLRSFLNKYHSIDHPLQHLAEQLFVEENGTVTMIAKAIKIQKTVTEIESEVKE
jgi:hypothetical protein